MYHQNTSKMRICPYRIAKCSTFWTTQILDYTNFNLDSMFCNVKGTSALCLKKLLYNLFKQNCFRRLLNYSIPLLPIAFHPPDRWITHFSSKGSYIYDSIFLVNVIGISKTKVRYPIKNGISKKCHCYFCKKSRDTKCKM